MNDYLAFGRYLRAQRELRGLPVDEIARRSKIPPTLIDALEEGQAERFPERVFLINYVRSYASIVGLDPDDALNRFEQIPEAPRAAEFDPAALEVVRRQRAISILWVCIAVAAVGLGAVVADTLYEAAVRASYR